MSLRRFAALSLLLMPLFAHGQGAISRTEVRPAKDGFVYVGTAPGVNFGGQSMPRALYMDFVHGGYVTSSGVDISLALSGMNWFPSDKEYSVSMGRFSLGWRPFLRDPLPMIQPYGFAGFGVGGEGRYLCKEESECDPTKDSCRTVCSRSHWVASGFLGAGVDFNSFLFFIGQQQLLFYAGVQARYEFLGRYNMPVITIPVGLRLQ
ncbi:hypothetical protein [Vulgatibacter incomptus]|uniref:Outer membrane protein beta-barrel domain-containing protein n=1 Tax=Vulgatibacter incomptus TaxID=1391653 RepID=A0A0K1PDJ3_9BACT|nr:hypothetical protein [Vulgatibacter incomptus]AKU91613.1 hypothetical protein AKJ08_2000 [Vulgatibacter incomptus]